MVPGGGAGSVWRVWAGSAGDADANLRAASRAISSRRADSPVPCANTGPAAVARTSGTYVSKRKQRVEFFIGATDEKKELPIVVTAGAAPVPGFLLKLNELDALIRCQHATHS